VSLLLVTLLLFLLFGGNRIGAAGRGLGEAVRHVKRAITDVDPKPPAPTMTELPVSKEPKLLPAKGESSASREADES
jgi:Sec-independent protein translocase protein TatA